MPGTSLAAVQPHRLSASSAARLRTKVYGEANTKSVFVWCNVLAQSRRVSSVLPGGRNTVEHLHERHQPDFPIWSELGYEKKMVFLRCSTDGAAISSDQLCRARWSITSVYTFRGTDSRRLGVCQTLRR